MSDRKKRLEEIRRKKRELEKQLQEATGAKLPPEPIPNPSNLISLIPSYIFLQYP